jgi:biotin carboxylase
VIAVDRDPGAPGFRYADTRALISTEDEEDVDRLARAERVDGVISPGADWPVGIAARIAERMGLPHPIDAATAARATSKQRQRERFAAAGVPHARLLDEPAAPCVVKAPDRQGQRGLTLVRTDAELPAAIEAALAASRNDSFIAEELVEGPEVTVNAISIDGVFHPLTVTDRLTADPPAFGVALAHAWPGERACVGTTQAPIAAARAAAEALGIRNGPTYTQVVLAADGPRVIELAARLGGGHDAELAEAVTGVRLNDLALDFALGNEARVTGTHSLHGGGCVVFLVAPEGVLQEVTGVEEARALEGVVDVRVYREPGHVFGPLLRGADRAGAVIAVGDSREQALERARAAADEIRFHVE